MPVAQSPAHYINSSKGCPSITESFPLWVFLELCATVASGATPLVIVMLCSLCWEIKLHDLRNLVNCAINMCRSVFLGRWPDSPEDI
jgi:hypothetical protein